VEKLMPLGILDTPTPSSELPVMGSALRVKGRTNLLHEAGIERVARVLRYMFSPFAALPLVAAVIAVHVWLYGAHGATASVEAVFRRPAWFLGVAVLVLLAAVFHELGHAAGLRYGGGRARALGVGFYLVFPTFFTDVSEAYGLGRRERLRTDLGGVFFHLIFALPIFALYAAFGQEWLLLAIVLIDLEVVRQLFPFVRLDGYWILADLTGVADPFSQALSWLQSRAARRGPASIGLRKGSRRIFLAYLTGVAVALPILFFLMLARSPSILSKAWNSGRALWDEFSSAAHRADLVAIGADGLQLIFLLLLVVGIGLTLYLLIVKPTRSVWRWSGMQPRPARWAFRGVLFAIIGGILVILGTLYPWSVFGPLIGVTRSGISGDSALEGRLALVAGVVLIGATPFLVFSRPRSRRRICTAAASFGASLAAIALTTLGIHRTAGQLPALVRGSLEQTTGATPSAHQVQEAMAGLDRLGISVHPGYGVYLALAGGIAALLGATVALVSQRRRRGARINDPAAAQASIT
jgi:hypothetical protein